MFQMKDEMQTAVKHNIRGGDGSPSFRYLFSAEQLGNRAEMMAVITLRPGESVGVHPHETNGEAYCILEGAATVTEDGESRELHVGDAEFCADGHTHSIRNHTGSVTRFLAGISFNFYIWHQAIAVFLKNHRIPAWEGETPPNQLGDAVWSRKYSSIVWLTALTVSIVLTFGFERPISRYLSKKMKIR